MKIFFGTKAFYLADNFDFMLNTENRKIIPVYSLEGLKTDVEKSMNQTATSEVVFVYNDLATLKKWFWSLFKLVEAAGGIVINNKKEFLLIYRKGKWDLPKGKIEKGETVEVAAIREVEEECGISGLSIVKQLPATYHVYVQDKKTILKPTYWFEMKTSFAGTLIPQEQEGITKVEWVKKENISALLPNAYESIGEVMSVYL